MHPITTYRDLQATLAHRGLLGHQVLRDLEVLMEYQVQMVYQGFQDLEVVLENVTLVKALLVNVEIKETKDQKDHLALLVKMAMMEFLDLEE